MNSFEEVPGLREAFTFSLELGFKTIQDKTKNWLWTKAGLRRRELWIMLCVEHAEFNQKRISEILHVDENTVSGLLKEMSPTTWDKAARQDVPGKDLIDRKPGEMDQREKIVILTDKGRAVLKKIALSRQAALKEVFSPLEKEEINQFREWCIKIASPEVNLDDTDS